MGKILESLPMTIVAGIVLTVIVILLAPVIAGSSDVAGIDVPDAVENMGDN